VAELVGSRARATRVAGARRQRWQVRRGFVILRLAAGGLRLILLGGRRLPLLRFLTIIVAVVLLVAVAFVAVDDKVGEFFFILNGLLLFLGLALGAGVFVLSGPVLFLVTVVEGLEHLRHGLGRLPEVVCLKRSADAGSIHDAVLLEN
jgi:hypothetical protein